MNLRMGEIKPQVLFQLCECAGFFPREGDQALRFLELMEIGHIQWIYLEYGR